MRNEKKAISINADAGKGQIMKIQDMVLVIENTKGSETNMLMTVKEYKEAYLFVSSLSREESAQALKELFDTKFSKPGTGWAERYITANQSYYAKFCSGSDELQCFLHGSYNDDKEFRFDREESSRECMWALEECRTGQTTEVAEYKGFSVLVEKNFMGGGLSGAAGKDGV